MPRKCKCSSWKENFPIINAPFQEPHSNYAPYEALPFSHCPWCSKMLFEYEEAPERLRVESTTINDMHHIRLYEDDKVIDEMVCEFKIDINYCRMTMLRWYDKMGGTSKMASSARDRLKGGKYNSTPRGRVWTQTQWERRGKTN